MHEARSMYSVHVCASKSVAQVVLLVVSSLSSHDKEVGKLASQQQASNPAIKPASSCADRQETADAASCELELNWLLGACFASMHLRLSVTSCGVPSRIILDPEHHRRSITAILGNVNFNMCLFTGYGVHTR